MWRITQTKTFRRDVKPMQKRGKDLAKLLEVIERLAKGEALEAKHRPHPLIGDWKPKWDCQVEPDWLLSYQVTEEEVLLARTGVILYGSWARGKAGRDSDLDLLVVLPFEGARHQVALALLVALADLPAIATR